MAITNNSKQAIRQEINKLEWQIDLLKKRIDELKQKKDSLVLRKNEMDQKILDLKADLNG